MIRTDCSIESGLALHIPSSSWKAYTLPVLYYIITVIVVAFVAEYWIGALVPAP